MLNLFSKMNFDLKKNLDIVYLVFGFNKMFIVNRKTIDETNLFDDC